MTKLGFATPLIKDESHSACLFELSLTDGVIEGHKNSLELDASPGSFAKLVAEALNEEVVKIEVIESPAKGWELNAILSYTSMGGEGVTLTLLPSQSDDSYLPLTLFRRLLRHLHNPNLYASGGGRGWEDNNWVVGENVNMMLGGYLKVLDYGEGRGGGGGGAKKSLRDVVEEEGGGRGGMDDTQMDDTQMDEMCLLQGMEPVWDTGKVKTTTTTITVTAATTTKAGTLGKTSKAATTFIATKIKKAATTSTATTTTSKAPTMTVASPQQPPQRMPQETSSPPLMLVQTTPSTKVKRGTKRRGAITVGRKSKR